MRITLRLASIEDLLSYRTRIKKDYRSLKRTEMVSEVEKPEKSAADSKPLTQEEIQQAKLIWNKGKVNLPQLPKFPKPRYFSTKFRSKI